MIVAHRGDGSAVRRECQGNDRFKVLGKLSPSLARRHFPKLDRLCSRTAQSHNSVVWRNGHLGGEEEGRLFPPNLEPGQLTVIFGLPASDRGARDRGRCNESAPGRERECRKIVLDFESAKFFPGGQIKNGADPILFGTRVL